MITIIIVAIIMGVMIIFDDSNKNIKNTMAPQL